MKVGILTFHRAVNYGAIFQAFALQKFMSRYCECEIVDYRCRHIEAVYQPIGINRSNLIRSTVSTILKYRTRKLKMNTFNNFLHENVKLSSKSYSKSELANAANCYDAFITGSDQVWNDSCAGFDKSFFLDFISDKGKKHSYAASFGFGEIPKQLKDEYRRLLTDYSNISTREESGAKIIKDLLKRDVLVHIDPTFLLTKTEWSKYAKPVDRNKKYILLYTVLKPSRIFELATSLSEATGCEIIYINDSPTKQLDATYMRGASPEEFLGLFSGAEYVITNSFHGTAFSIIFGKKFLAEINSGGIVNHRVMNILRTLNLEERMISQETLIRDAEKEIDYDEVLGRVEVERNKSAKYLKSIIA